MTQPRKNRKRPHNISTWIRQRTSPYCFGVKSRAGNPAHCNRNDDIEYHSRCLRLGIWGRRLSRLSNADMADHFAGRKTFYFTADGRSATEEVLINLDIDCHKSGSLAGAISFAEHLKATRFPGLYYEASTNGNGVHGYLVVVKGDLGDEGLNGALSVLDRWLKAELSRGDRDVEDVEVKGQAPVFGWGMKKFELKTYKSGQLAKLPREALTRADELRGTTRLAVSELRRLYTEIPQVESQRSRPTEPEGESIDSVVSGADRARGRSVVFGRADKKAAGSIAGRHFGEDELSNLDGSYSSLVKDLLGEAKLVAAGRKVVTVVDLAIFLMLLRLFSLNMNADGSLPTARWREMWTALFEAGDIDRGWCHHRYARMRNFLAENDLLAWDDEDFVAGVVGDHGRFVPGRAAKWRASEELMSRMEAIAEVDQVLGQDGDVVVEVEEDEEGESILYRHSQQDQIHEGEKEEEESILYGHNQNQLTVIPFKPRQSEPLPPVNPLYLRQPEPLREVLDRLGIDLPLQKPRFVGYAWGQTRMAA